MFTVPEDFARATVAREGDAGREWINDLPRRVEVLCEQWNLVVDGPVMNGYFGLAIPVRHGDEPCVLKVSWINESTVDEATALKAWNGQGTVRLLDEQPSLGAMLLERLDHRRSLNTVEIAEAVAVAGRLLRRLAIPATVKLRPLHTMAENIARSLPQRWLRYGRPMPRYLLDQASDLAVQLGETAGNLLVDYDLHYADILAGKREPWLAVDPKVVVGDPEFGVAQLLWCRLEDMENREGLDRYFQTLISAAELDPELTRAWTMVRCIDYWLWGLSTGLTDDPARCKVIVNWLS